MTGSTDATEMMAAGCVGYIPKPLRTDEFPRLVWGFLQATTLRAPRPGWVSTVAAVRQSS